MWVTVSPALQSLLRTPLERRAVGDADATPLRRDPAGVLELAHRTRHGFAAGPDNVRDRLVRERLLDLVAASLLRGVEEHPRDAARYVEQHERADLAVGSAEAPREFGE